MAAGESDEFDDSWEEAGDAWDDFRGDDGDPIGLAELKALDLKDMPDDIHICVMDDYFPETTISRHGDTLICSIQEHLYTKYWEHKFSAYAFPHVAKAAECVTVVLQEEGKGATWMFEDAYAKHKQWHKLTYQADRLEVAVEEAVAWAEKFVHDFADYQKATLPWLRATP